MPSHEIHTRRNNAKVQPRIPYLICEAKNKSLEPNLKFFSRPMLISNRAHYSQPSYLQAKLLNSVSQQVWMRVASFVPWNTNAINSAYAFLWLAVDAWPRASQIYSNGSKMLQSTLRRQQRRKYVTLDGKDKEIQRFSNPSLIKEK